MINYGHNAPINLHGYWETTKDCIRHSRLTDSLDDYLQFSWQGKSCDITISSSTGKKIAVVVTLNGAAITPPIAGTDIEYGEGQSFIFVQNHKKYHLLNCKKNGEWTMRLATRSDKLQIYRINTK